MKPLQDYDLAKKIQEQEIEIQKTKQGKQEWICISCIGCRKHISHDQLPRFQRMYINPKCILCGVSIDKNKYSYSLDSLVEGFLKIEVLENLKFAYAIGKTGISLEKIIHDSIKFKKCTEVCKLNGLEFNNSCPCFKVCIYIVEKLYQNSENSSDGILKFYDRNKKYRFKTAEEIDISSLEQEWLSIAKSLTHENRYFNIKAKDFFHKIMYYATMEENEEDRYSILTEISADQELYRARDYSDDSQMNKIKNNIVQEMYAPVPRISSDNRMSASGVSLLYLADKVETCKAELDNCAPMIFAKFKIIDQIIFFDFTKFDCNFQSNIFNSVFEYFYKDNIKMQNFLKYCINEHISASTENKLDYVMTQALCNYIQVWIGWGERKISGVIYKSAKYSDGKNYAIFEPHKCMVKRKFHITLHDSNL